MASINPTSDIGFVEERNELTCKRLKCKFFPSKVGGKPLFLGLSPLPSQDDLKCPKCCGMLTFLLQVYVPIEDNDEAFHRTLFLFACTHEMCCKGYKVFRSQLKRSNSFYSYEPPDYDDLDGVDYDPSPEKFGQNVCQVCGLPALQHCSKCKAVYYCCKMHQIFDWKDGNHKSICGRTNVNKSQDSAHQNKLLLPEYEVTVEPEEPEDQEEEEDEDDDIDHENGDDSADGNGSKKQGLAYWLEKYKPQLQDENLDQYVSEASEDKVFNQFKKRIKNYEEQIFRYYHGAKSDCHQIEPLWITGTNKPENIPNCCNCGSERRFEFQVMPQLIYQLKAPFDYGILAIYTCKQNCTPQKEGFYLEEYVWVQNIE